MKRILVLLAAAAASLSLAAVASGATSGVAVRGGGTVLAHGTVGPTARFVLYVGSDLKSNALTYTQPGISFRALSMTRTLFGTNDAKLQGMALVNGKDVHYTAIVVSHPTSVDIFKLDWSHHASVGGTLRSGTIDVVPQVRH